MPGISHYLRTSETGLGNYISTIVSTGDVDPVRRQARLTAGASGDLEGDVGKVGVGECSWRVRHLGCDLSSGE